MVSKKFREAVKLSSKRAYQIANGAGIHHTTLSRIMNGIERTRPNDPRVLAVAAVLGLPPDECFVEEKQ